MRTCLSITNSKKKNTSRKTFNRNYLTNTHSSGYAQRNFSTASTASAFDSTLHPSSEVTHLDNNLRVATEAFPSGITTLGVYIDAGSSYENDQNNGTAHFLEHMAFKGTPTRTQQSIELEVENIGGVLNAYTGREQTAYIVQCTNEHVDHMVEILSDILLRSNYHKSYIESERSVILQEKHFVEEDEEELIFDHVHACAYQGQTLGRPILGEDRHIKSLQRNDMVDFVQTHYTGPRMVIAASGGTPHETIVESANRHFGQVSGEIKFDMDQYKNDVNFTPSQIVLNDQKRKDMRVVYAFEGETWSSSDLYVQLVVQILLGTWDKYVPLPAKEGSLADICASAGLANNFMSYNTCYKYSGLVGINANITIGKTREFGLEMAKELIRIGTELTEEELEVAKHKAVVSTLAELNTTELITEEIGRQILTLNRRMSPLEAATRINSITLDDIQRYFHNIFYNSAPVIVYLGPKDDVPDYEELRNSLIVN